MQSLKMARREDFTPLTTLLSDLDDTLTLQGQLPAATYQALEQLSQYGITIVIVTGRPAGWCGLIARMWPVAAVVGENGAFYFRYDHSARQMRRQFQRTAEERRRDTKRLLEIFSCIKARFPQVQLSADQSFRISDVAVDFCEDVEPILDRETVATIVDMFQKGGATAKISSIHVNAWMGTFSKLEMSLRLLQEEFGVGPEKAKSEVLYIGDSPNDEPMFATFKRTVGVSNIRPFLDGLTSCPRWITENPGGRGFEELAHVLLRVR